MSLRLLVGAIAVAAIACRVPEERVVVAYPAGPAAVIPNTSNEEYTTSIQANVYEPLVDLDAHLALSPGLARDWHTPDETTWIFALQPGVRLHDGRPLTAPAVAACLERARSGADSRRTAELAEVDSIRALDETRVEIHTRQPMATLPNRLAQIMVWVPALSDGLPPVGTGPYRIRRLTLGDEIVLDAWDGYRGGRPALDVLEFRAIREVADRIEKLQRGEVHVVPEPPPGVQAGGISTVSGPGLRVIFLGMDCGRERSPFVAEGGVNPLRDVRVRRAVAAALDRAGLVRGPLAGQAHVLDQFVPPEVFGHDEELPPLAHDPAGARRLLAEAGQAAGFDVVLDFAPTRYRAMDRVAAAVAADLGAVGIRVRLRSSDASGFIERLNHRSTSFFLAGWLSDSGDAEITFDYLFHSPVRGYGQHDVFGYANPEVDGALEHASRPVRTRERKALLASVAQALRRDMPAVPLYRQHDLYALAPGVELTPRLDRRILGTALRRVPR